MGEFRMTAVATDDLEKILEMWEQDASVDQTNLGSEAVKAAKLHSKYLKILSRNSLIVKKLDNDYKTMRAIRAKYYEGKMDQAELTKYGWEQFQYNFKLKEQREAALEGDEYLLKIIGKKAYHEEIVSACTAIIKELGNRTWGIKSAIDWQRFTNGG
jgi:hypothetical protein